jgi:hypothetical protein
MNEPIFIPTYCYEAKDGWRCPICEKLVEKESEHSHKAESLINGKKVNITIDVFIG